MVFLNAIFFIFVLENNPVTFVTFWGVWDITYFWMIFIQIKQLLTSFASHLYKAYLIKFAQKLLLKHRFCMWEAGLHVQPNLSHCPWPAQGRCAQPSSTIGYCITMPLSVLTIPPVCLLFWTHSITITSHYTRES